MRLFGVDIEVDSCDEQDSGVDTSLGLSNKRASTSSSGLISTGNPTCSVSRTSTNNNLTSSELSIEEYSNSNSNSDHDNKGKKKRLTFEELISDPDHRALMPEDNADDFVVYNPMPLRSYYPPMEPPIIINGSSSSSSSVSSSADHNRSGKCSTNKIRSLNKEISTYHIHDDASERLVSSSVIPKSSKVKKQRIRKNKNNQKNSPSVVPDDGEEEAVKQLIHHHEYSTRPAPEFLYSKCMQEADIKRDQNRVLLTTSQNLMSFLNEDERNAVDAQGIELGAMDEKGNLYELRLKRWPSVNMFILNKDWNKLTSYNQINAGHWLHIWGYRRNNGELRLVIIFKKTDDQHVNVNVGSTSSAGTSS